MNLPVVPCFFANRAVETDDHLVVHDKYHGTPVWAVCHADATLMDAAIAAAAEAAPAMAQMKPYERQRILRHCHTRLQDEAADLTTILVREGGKPIGAARAEVSRLLRTFELAAEAAGRPVGAMHDLRGSLLSGAALAFERRFPIGPCAFITPFNFPLNLVAHKVAPALAVGCPFVLKPASATPVSALRLGTILAETDLPPGAFSILPATRAAADRLVTDERLRFLSFTGSASVGWDLKRRAGKKRVTLELGGNAAAIVAADADLDAAVQALVQGGFTHSGQSCISVQRILVHRSLVAPFTERLLASVKGLAVGDPADETTTVGPLIDEGEARRLTEWIAEAAAGDARVLCGGGRDGAILEPTLLDRVPETCRIWAEEAFGPVVVLRPFDTLEEAFALVNASRYGLQAALFTRDMDTIMQAWDKLHVGAVIVNESSSFRDDAMPYGGVKDSGLGREGVHSAMDEMTEPRLLVIPHAG
ncbi:MAG: aldehyde dehydrogenase family protein [Pseudomonadota bacterium]